MTLFLPAWGSGGGGTGLFFGVHLIVSTSSWSPVGYHQCIEVGGEGEGRVTRAERTVGVQRDSNDVASRHPFSIPFELFSFRVVRLRNAKRRPRAVDVTS